MVTIRINGEALDLPADQNVQTVLNSSLFFGGSTTSIPGNYSLPFTLDLTPTNRQLLNNPDLLDSAELALFDEPCTITIGNESRTASFGIQRVAGGVVQSFVIIDVLTALGTTKLTDIDLGGDRDLDTTIADALVDAMPNADYCLIPMRGLPEELIDPGGLTLTPNLNVNNGAYSTNVPVCPAIRLEYILNQIADHIGVRLVNNFQINDELKSLMVVSNTIFFEASDTSPTDIPTLNWPESINLSNCMADWTCAEFFKRLRINFNMGYAYNATSRTLTVSLAKHAVNSRVHDWTQYVDSEPSIETDTSRPRDIIFAESDARYDFRSDFTSEIAIRDTSLYDSEFVLIRSENIIVRCERRGGRGGSPIRWVGKEEFHYQPLQRVGTELDNDLELPFATLVDVRDILHQGGSYRYEEIEFTNTVSNEIVTIPASTSDITMRLAFFRGRGSFQLSGSTFTNVPRGSVGDTLQDGTLIQYLGNPVQHSLNLQGDQGIYEQHHKLWWDYIARRRIVTFRFTIPPSVFSLYQDTERIQVSNQVYLPRTLKVRSATNDRLVIDVEFISCF